MMKKDMITVFITPEDKKRLDEIEDITTYGEGETIIMDTDPWRLSLIMIVSTLSMFLFFGMMLAMIIHFPWEMLFS